MPTRRYLTLFSFLVLLGGADACFVPHEEQSQNETSETEMDSFGQESQAIDGSESDDSSETQVPDCSDPLEDCPLPENPCVEAFCDDQQQCAQRSLPDNTVVGEWSDYSECEYADACSEQGLRSRSRDVCISGRVSADEEKDQAGCDRNTDGVILEEGEYDECRAEAFENESGCREIQYRQDSICQDGSPTTSEPIPQECSAESALACGQCGNGVVETSLGENCEPSQDFCNGACKWVVYVDDTATGNNDGSSWKNAFTNLQDGIDQAYTRNNNSQPTEVWVAQGTYKAKGVRKGFEISGSMSIYGGFAGDENTLEQRGAIDPSLTILSGDLNGDDEPEFINRSDNSTRVVWVHKATGETRLDGFTVEGGYATGTDPSDGGSGLGIWAQTRLANMIIRDNYVSYGGAGVLSRATTIIADNVAVENNYAVGWGGGFFVSTEGVIVEGELVVRNNTAKNDKGGGLWINSGKLEIKPNATAIFENNSAFRGGGGFATHGANVLVKGHNAKMVLRNNESYWGGGGFRSSAWETTGTPAIVTAEDGGEIEILENLVTNSKGGGFYNESNCLVQEVDGGQIHGGGNSAALGGDGFYSTYTLTEADFDFGDDSIINGN